MTPAGAVGIVGAGRAGLGLGMALRGAGCEVRLYGRRHVAVPPPLTLDIGPIDRPPPWLAGVEVVLLAVRDEALEPAAAVLARAGVVTPQHVILHLSGCRSTEVLEALRGTGAALGSLHPLQTITEPAGTAQALRGARAGVEGDPRAVDCAMALARRLGMVPLRIAPAEKPRYHAAAVFASNYVVVCAAVGERLLREAGVPAPEAWAALMPLVEGAFRNLHAAAEPGAALTGPVVRGDAETVRRHLAVLAASDADLYRRLAAVALAVAQARGLDPAPAARIASLLNDEPDPAEDRKADSLLRDDAHHGGG